jgi:Zn-finger nucleic acid-binding protein
MPVLICPNCQAGMQEVNRSNVALDICTQCRGVWLDRGELEKLLGEAREARETENIEREQQEQYNRVRQEREKQEQQSFRDQPPREFRTNELHNEELGPVEKYRQERRTEQRDEQPVGESRRERDRLDYNTNYQGTKYPHRKKSFIDRIEDIFD